jgi:purine-nucleoside phosphorylase
LAVSRTHHRRTGRETEDADPYNAVLGMRSAMGYDELSEAAGHIRIVTGREHSAAVILGSGLSDYATAFPDAIEMPYLSIPYFPVTKVEGHAGAMFSVPVDDHFVLLYAGRVHTYEGWDLNDVVFGARTAVLAGCHSVVLTNAAGGVGDGLVPGDLVAIRDHLNLTARNPLTGDNDDRLGPRFPDMSTTYDATLRDALASVASGQDDIEYKEGVYAWFLGPSYETPAEVQMARTLGADLVGMSTVPEAIALNHMGARVCGISLVTNLAAGISDTPLSHEEVKHAATTASDRFTRLLDGLLPHLIDQS